MFLLSTAWACPDATQAVVQAEGAVLELRAEEAEAALTDAVAGFACGPEASPELVARFFLAQGMTAGLADYSQDADFRAAHRAEPSVWVTDYGPVNYGAWQEAGGKVLEDGTLRLTPTPTVRRVWIDGRPATPETTLESGRHLVQVGTLGKMEFAEVVSVPADRELLLDTGLTPIRVELPTPAAPEVQRSVNPLLVGAGGAAAAAVGVSLAGMTQTGAMREAPDEATLNQAYSRQKTLLYTSYALGAVSAVTFTVYLGQELR